MLKWQWRIQYEGRIFKILYIKDLHLTCEEYLLTGVLATTFIKGVKKGENILPAPKNNTQKLGAKVI